MTTWVCFGLGSLTDFTRRSCPLMPRWTTRVSPSSSVMSRYLPSRPTDLIVRPSSRPRNCLAEGWRRTERPLATATALIFLPTTSRDRSWRRVSTSGSSGTGGQLLPGAAGRLLFRILLGAALAPAHRLPRKEDLGHVGAVVIRPRSLDHVAGGSLAVAHRPLLEPALVVEVVRFQAGPLNGLSQLTKDKALRSVPAGVEVDRAQNGLEGVGQDGRLG